MAAHHISAKSPTWPDWERLFYQGDRLRAEVLLLASRFVGDIDNSELSEGSSQIKRSFGVDVARYPLSSFALYQSSQPEPKHSSDSWKQLLPVADVPDALLFWGLHRRLPAISTADSAKRIQLLQRLAILLLRDWSCRPDLPYQVLMRDSTGTLFKSAPRRHIAPGLWYSRPEPYMFQLQVAWTQGRYESMWLGWQMAQLYGRYFPFSDHHIRGFSMIGEAERCLYLFKQIYDSNPSEFRLGSISNMLFMALGLDQVPHDLVHTLVSHFRHLSAEVFASSSPTPSPSAHPRRLVVNEKPLLVVVSSDLRQHPVGRFWLPIARKLRSRFQVISVAGYPRDQDHIRDELQQLSDEWWPLEADDVVNTATRISSKSPSILIDLGGHTADNHPVFLSRRLATVQATYLGFYAPTYADCCDWWIIDQALMEWIQGSYPGAESFWPLPGPSLCYVPDLHGLPDIEQTIYRETNHPVLGSFNHTRKITRATQKRFGAVLSENPDAVLQFRSHSFMDPTVRRYFLQRFTDNGIAPHQLQPLPFAPSSKEAVADYGRIHLHLDSYPVSGTTTTLDSIAMGIPVLTCPTPYYAGAISAAILTHAGLGDHICSTESELPSHARWLAELYRTPNARRDLAYKVRQSSICDDQLMPNMFVDQLAKMLQQAKNI